MTNNNNNNNNGIPIRTSQQNEGIEVPESADVLCGRGGHCTTHPGNIKFRMICDQHKEQFWKSSKQEKLKLASEIIMEVSPGRFLKQKGELWYDIGPDAAVKKVFNSLRQQIPTDGFLAAMRKQDSVGTGGASPMASPQGGGALISSAWNTNPGAPTAPQLPSAAACNPALVQYMNYLQEREHDTNQSQLNRAQFVPWFQLGACQQQQHHQQQYRTLLQETHQQLQQQQEQMEQQNSLMFLPQQPQQAQPKQPHEQTSGWPASSIVSKPTDTISSYNASDTIGCSHLPPAPQEIQQHLKPPAQPMVDQEMKDVVAAPSSSEGISRNSSNQSEASNTVQQALKLMRQPNYDSPSVSGISGGSSSDDNNDSDNEDDSNDNNSEDKNDESHSSRAALPTAAHLTKDVFRD